MIRHLDIAFSVALTGFFASRSTVQAKRSSHTRSDCARPVPGKLSDRGCVCECADPEGCYQCNRATSITRSRLSKSLGR